MRYNFIIRRAEAPARAKEAPTVTRIKIALTTINDVKAFVDAVSRCDFAVDLSGGRYTVDGKSIMGIFSLDLSQPLDLLAYTDDPAFAESMAPFAVE